MIWVQMLGLVHATTHAVVQNQHTSAVTVTDDAHDHGLLHHQAGDWSCVLLDGASNLVGDYYTPVPAVTAPLRLALVVPTRPDLPIFCLTPCGLRSARAPPHSV